MKPPNDVKSKRLSDNGIVMWDPDADKLGDKTLVFRPLTESAKVLTEPYE